MAQAGDKKQHSKSPSNEEMKSSLEFKTTRTDAFAVFMTNFLGSTAFLACAIIFFVVWICWNLFSGEAFDKFPFPALEMVVSVFAIILSVTVLINQNRQGRMEKIQQQVEFEINVRAEHEITKMLNMLHDIQKKLGIKIDADEELEEMKEITDVQGIHHKIDNSDEA